MSNRFATLIAGRNRRCVDARRSSAGLCTGQEDRAGGARHSADLLRDDRLCRREGRLLQEIRRQRLKSARSITAPPRRAPWFPATSTWRWSPTPPVINQISNSGVPLVAIYGMPNPDWVLGSTEPGKKCKDIEGQAGRRRFGRRRALDCAALDAGRLPRRQDRRRPAGRARLRQPAPRWWPGN